MKKKNEMDGLFFISQNTAICPKTFSNSTDRHCYRHAGDTSSDISPIKVQSQVIMVSGDFTEY
jgi:hypothetical protein